jgi:hypothetical protein
MSIENVLRSKWSSLDVSAQASMIVGPLEGTLLLFLTAPALGEWRPLLSFEAGIFLDPVGLLSFNGLLFVLWLLLLFSVLALFTLTPFFIYSASIALLLAPLSRMQREWVGFLLSKVVIVSTIILLPLLLALWNRIPLFP